MRAGARREGAQDEQEPGQRGGPRGDDWAVRRRCGLTRAGALKPSPPLRPPPQKGRRRCDRRRCQCCRCCTRPSRPHLWVLLAPLLCLLACRTDALRYTLATGTSPGQDLSLSLDRVNSSRNFTNKLWNAGKFVLFNLDKVSGGCAPVASPAACACAPRRALLDAPQHRQVGSLQPRKERNDAAAGRAAFCCCLAVVCQSCQQMDSSVAEPATEEGLDISLASHPT